MTETLLRFERNLIIDINIKKVDSIYFTNFLIIID